MTIKWLCPLCGSFVLPTDRTCQSRIVGSRPNGCPLEKLTREDLLVGLIEEASEVIKAATKILQFGWDRNQPGYGVNHEVLAKKVGEFMAIQDELDLDAKTMLDARAGEIQRMSENKAKYGAK